MLAMIESAHLLITQLSSSLPTADSLLPRLLAQGPPWLNLPTTILLLAVLSILALAALGGEILRRQPDAVINHLSELPAVARRILDEA